MTDRSTQEEGDVTIGRTSDLVIDCYSVGVVARGPHGMIQKDSKAVIGRDAAIKSAYSRLTVPGGKVWIYDSPDPKDRVYSEAPRPKE